MSLDQGNNRASDNSTLDSISLDMESSEPLYRQLHRQLRAKLAEGGMDAMTGLPAERALADKLGVSRNVVKRCYDALKAENLLSAHGRGGTRLSQPPRVNPEMGRLKGFTQEMQELGRVPSTRLVEADIIADRTIASLFKRPSTADFLRLVRVRLADGVPMSHEVAWYDLTLAPELAHWDRQGSAYDFLQATCGIALDWAQQSIEAISSSPEEARVFGFASPQACLLIKRHTYSRKSELVEYVEGVFRGDAYTYQLRLKV